MGKKYLYFISTVIICLGVWPNNVIAVVGAMDSDLNRLIRIHGFTTQKQVDRKLEMYFDTPEFILLKNNLYLKYDANEYFSKKNKRKYNEKIEFLAPDGKAAYLVKHYNRAKSHEGKHLLLGMVKRTDRTPLIAKLKASGVTYPLRLKMVFTVSKNIHTYTVFDDKKPLGTIVLEDIQVGSQKDTVDFTQIMISGKNNKNLNVLSDELKKMHVNTFNLSEDENRQNEYVRTFNQMKKQIRFFHFKLQYPYIFHISNAGFFVAIGLIIIKILYWKRVFRLGHKLRYP